MAPPANKRRKLCPSSSEANHNKTYAQDTAGQNSSNGESEIVRSNGATRNVHTTAEAKRDTTASWNSGTSHSSMFKLKANELLAKVRPDEKRTVMADISLRKLKDIIERIPIRESKPVCNSPFVSIWPVNRLTLHRFSKRSANSLIPTKSGFHSPNPGPQKTQSTHWPTLSQQISIL